jgi:hypothetical protein
MKWANGKGFYKYKFSAGILKNKEFISVGMILSIK